ncbi:MAG: hypothetical protein GY751_26855 [Bacteroidetes bacterium]|nr:hypothetical protein [Bacteroidota bacterium]
MSDQSPPDFSLNSKFLLYAGLVLQGLFLIGAILLFKERTLYADTAHFAAEIEGGNLVYVGHRFIALFTRLLPFLNVIAGGSIKTGLVFYSINLALIFTVPYLLLVFVLKDRTMAFCLLLFQFIFTYRTYYLSISELQHSLVILLVYWAYIKHLMRSGRPASRSIWTYLLLAIMVNAHPLFILAFGASAVLFSEHESYWNKDDQKLLVPAAFLFFILFSFAISSKYEAVVSSNALGNTLTNIDTYTIRLMLSTLFHDFLPSILTGLLGIGVVLFHYSFRKSLFILFCTGIAGISVYLRFAHITLTLTFFEIYLLPVFFILFLAIGLNWERFSKDLPKVILPVIISLILFQVIRVAMHADFYRNRLAIYSSVMDQMEEKQMTKVVLPFYKAPMNEIVDFYTSPFESYLLSKIDDNPANDGYMISYLLEDSINIEVFEKYEQHIITIGIDSIDVYPISRFPKLGLSSEPYHTFDPVY